MNVGSASPPQVQAYLGSPQWFDLLNRPSLAALDVLYDFARLLPAASPLRFEPLVSFELIVSLLLMPLVHVDMP